MPLFIFIPTCLTILIIMLIVRLKVKRRTIDYAGIPNIFGKEMKNLLMILVLFDISFVFRLIFDEYITEKLVGGNVWNYCRDSEGWYQLCDPFPIILYDLITQYFWDYIPILCILLFHKTNFSTLQD